MNGLLELDLWRILGQGNDEIGEGYSGSGRGSARPCPSFQPVHFMVFEIRCFGAHSHVARPFHSSLASPMPVYAGARLCSFDRLNHGHPVASPGMCTAYGMPVCLAMRF
ncbi:hypothetical protein GOBAR_AA12451 [Gossypium barbadense]|uniref:Uncharacterized protein n=1 Tax=Gossypium barbadense TaxID=3634 RepID=A0A2P5XXY4_GOSBA|nr:hypothetical protein GOBAR_AA12451 [Gossypium barbadense]